jgi:hypothetical protein
VIAAKYSMGYHRIAHRLTVLVMLTAACVQPSSSPSPLPPSTHEVPAAHDSTRIGSGLAVNIYRPGSMSYDYTLTSRIRSITGDSIPRVDTTEVSALVSATFGSSEGRSAYRAEIAIDSAVITSSSITGENRFVPRRVQSISIDPESGKLQHVQVEPTSCTFGQSEPPLLGDELLPVIPARDIVGRSWADTTRYQLCRGGVALLVTRVARYRAQMDNPLPEGTAASIRVFRVSEVTFTGQGNQWQQPVQASGIGSSIDTLTIGGTPARLRSINGSSQMQIEFHSGIRLQRFLQASTVRAIARN